MASNTTIKRIGLLTGGGDCPGLNAVIRAVTKSAILAHHIEVIGIEDALLGLIEDRMRPLCYSDVSNILDLGGTILGTSNKSNPERFCVRHDENDQPVFENVTDRVLANIEKAQLDAIVCIGGDGTMSAVSKLTEHGIKMIGIPKTIDNDLMHTDMTFGFDTAVATATDAIDRIHTTASSHHRVMVVEMMGRNAGWLTLYSGTAGGADVILIPEIPYRLDRICEYCIGRMNKHKAHTIVAIAEGAMPVGGDVVVDRVVQESPDPIRLGGVSEILCEQISQCTKIEARATILGHVQRGGRPTAYDRVLATQLGHHAVNMIAAGQFDRMVAVQKGQLTTVPIADVADKTKQVPLDHSVIAACRAIGVSFGD